MKRSMLIGMALVAIGLATNPIQADTIYQTSDLGGFGDDWNEAAWGEPAAVPTEGNDYIATMDLRNSVDTVFGGDTLQLEAGSRLDLKQNTAEVSGGWILNGGEISNPDNKSAIREVIGDVSVAADSILRASKGNVVLSGVLSGSGNISALFRSSTGQPTKYIALNGGGSYSGTITASDFSIGEDLTNVLQLGASLENASLALEDNVDYDLSGSVSLKSFSADGVTLGVGTYDAAALSSAGITSFVDNGGSLTVVPEPATMTLLGLGALGYLRRRRA